MCDPFSLGIASAVGSVAATAGSMMMQQKAADSQNRANDAWRNYQKQQREAENQRQEGLRRQAEEARAKGVEEIAPEKQKEAQEVEAQRLSSELQANTSVNEAGVGDKLLSGQQLGGESFQTDVASRLNNASKEARDRIAALAQVQSYGGSFGGLGNRNAEVLAKADQGINLANNQRQGSLSAFNLAKSVNPIQNPTQTDPFGGIASSLAGIAGKGLGTAFAPTVKA
jgi:hypothetical protein